MAKQKGYWLNALNIRPNEWWLVKKLFVMQFMQGAGIAFFFTASFTLFLHEVGITKLPYVFIYSSGLLLHLYDAVLSPCQMPCVEYVSSGL